MSSTEDRMLRHFLHNMAVGFALLMLLLTAVVGYSLVQLDQLADDMADIVQHINRKQQIATDMQVAGYHRSDALYNMALTDDPFERDEHFMSFNRGGFDVGAARNALRELGMEGDSAKVFDQQSLLIERVVTAQDQVVDMLSNEDHAGARRILQSQVLPVQAHINETFQTIRDIEALKAASVLRQTHDGTRSTLLVALILGVACVLIGSITAMMIYRKVSHQSAQITEHLVEVEKAREVADKANRSKSDFLATMSHEIRTPMNGVLGMVALMRTTPLNQIQSDYLETIASSSEILLTLLNDILDLSKIEAGHLELESIDFHLERLIDGVVLLMSGKAKLKGLELNSLIDPDVPLALKGDPTRLRQILFNLLSNAIKFTDEGSVTLSIETLKPGEGGSHLRISVRDTGIGIAPESMNHLFDAFTQADRSITRRFGGTGLGLAVCHKLVTAMGGKIGAVSSPGQGSEFIFELPLEEGNPNNISGRAMGEKPLVSTRGPLNVLLVEDDQVNQTVARGLLENQGHQVEIANNGQEAVDAASSKSYDVILMDVQMPVMDGLEATSLIRQLEDPAHASVPIIALTASIAPETIRQCEQTGVNGVLGKPIKPDALFAELGRISPAARRTRLSDKRSIDEIIAADIDRAAIAKIRDSIGPDSLDELVQIFDDSSQNLMSELSQAWEQGDYTVMAQKAHRLRGSSLSLGLRALAMLARDTEKAASDGRAASVRDLLIRLTSVRDHSLDELRSIIASAR